MSARARRALQRGIDRRGVARALISIPRTAQSTAPTRPNGTNRPCRWGPSPRRARQVRARTQRAQRDRSLARRPMLPGGVVDRTGAKRRAPSAQAACKCLPEGPLAPQRAGPNRRVARTRVWPRHRLAGRPALRESGSVGKKEGNHEYGSALHPVLGQHWGSIMQARMASSRSRVCRLGSPGSLQ